MEDNINPQLALAARKIKVDMYPQDAVASFLTAPAVGYFVWVFFDFTKNQNFIYAVIATLLVVAGLGPFYKQALTRVLHRALSSLQSGRPDPALLADAKRRSVTYPFWISLSPLVKWNILGSFGVILPFYLSGRMTAGVLLDAMFILFLGSLISLPTYYLMSENAMQPFRDIPEIATANGRLPAVADLNLGFKLSSVLFLLIFSCMAFIGEVFYLMHKFHISITQAAPGVIILMSAILIETIIRTRYLKVIMIIPFERIAHQMMQLATSDADLTRSIAYVLNDEIGKTAAGFNAVMQRIEHIVNNIQATTSQLNMEADNLTEDAGTLTANAATMADQSLSVVNAAEEMSANMHLISTAMVKSSETITIVASGASQMTQTVNEITRNTENARTISANATAETRQAAEQMSRLQKNAQETGSIIETINEIADQTSLLALNATIEAARAGDYGKGFAVVADEIKQLSNQTALAIDDIRQKLEMISAATTASAKTINTISTIIASLDDIVSGIATALEEQSITIGDMANNIHETGRKAADISQSVTQASGVAEMVTKDMTQLNQSVDKTKTTGVAVKQSADTLQSISSALQSLVKSVTVASATEGRPRS